MSDQQAIVFTARTLGELTQITSNLERVSATKGNVRIPYDTPEEKQHVLNYLDKLYPTINDKTEVNIWHLY